MAPSLYLARCGQRVRAIQGTVIEGGFRDTRFFAGLAMCGGSVRRNLLRHLDWFRLRGRGNPNSIVNGLRQDDRQPDL